MSALLITVVLVFQPVPECGAFSGCSQGHTIIMRGDPPASRVFRLDPSLVTFPHFHSKNRQAWRRCGQEVAHQAGVELGLNQLVTLCHEAKHTVHGRSHNQ